MPRLVTASVFSPARRASRAAIHSAGQESQRHQHAVGVQETKCEKFQGTLQAAPPVLGWSRSSISSPLPMTMAESATLNVGHW